MASHTPGPMTGRALYDDYACTDQTDVRPRGETEAEFMKRLAGKQSYQMTLIDWLRFCAYEYMAGGERAARIVACGLGTEDARRAYYWSAMSSVGVKP